MTDSTERLLYSPGVPKSFTLPDAKDEWWEEALIISSEAALPWRLVAGSLCWLNVVTTVRSGKIYLSALIAI